MRLSLNRHPMEPRGTSWNPSELINLSHCKESEQFPNRPRLERTPARREGRLGVRDFGKMAEAQPIELADERPDEAIARLDSGRARVVTHANPGFDECAHQPRPDRALVVRVVARPGVAFIARRVAAV